MLVRDRLQTEGRKWFPGIERVAIAGRARCKFSQWNRGLGKLAQDEQGLTEKNVAEYAIVTAVFFEQAGRANPREPAAVLGQVRHGRFDGAKQVRPSLRRGITSATLVFNRAGNGLNRFDERIAHAALAQNAFHFGQSHDQRCSRGGAPPEKVIDCGTLFRRYAWQRQSAAKRLAEAQTRCHALDEAGQRGLAECLLEAIWIVDHVEGLALCSGKTSTEETSSISCALPLTFAMVERPS